MAPEFLHGRRCPGRVAFGQHDTSNQVAPFEFHALNVGGRRASAPRGAWPAMQAGRPVLPAHRSCRIRAGQSPFSPQRLPGAEATTGLASANAAPAAPPDAAAVAPTPENAKKAERIQKQVGNSANPRAAEKALNASDRALLKAFNTVTNTLLLAETKTPTSGPGAGSTPVEGGPTMGIMAAGCWNVSHSSVARNAFGSWLYKRTVSGGFCTNRSYVYSKWFNGSWGETYWIGWRDGGQTYANAVIASGSARIVGQRAVYHGVGG